MKFNHYGSDVARSYKVAVLSTDINLSEINKHYLMPAGISPDDVIVLELYKDPTRKTTPRKVLVDYWEEVREELKFFGVVVALICDGDYFKAVTKETKTDANIGYFFEDVGTGTEVTYVPNYKRIFYDPMKTGVLVSDAMRHVSDKLNGLYVPPGTNVINTGIYITDYVMAACWLEKLHAHPALTVDVETYDLKFYKSGLGSISLSWTQNDGISILVANDKKMMALLATFFEQYQGKMIMHHAAFDSTILIYNLYMQHLTDQENLLKGLEIFTRDLECTRIISYLATNSCAGNELGLKTQAREFIGNYAVDVTDITKLSTEDLLKYNLEDTLATWYVFNKNTPLMIRDQQEDIYRNIFLPALKDVIQMQLTGMPLSMPKVLEAERVINGVLVQTNRELAASKYVEELIDLLKGEWVVKRNSELKTKQVTVDDCKITFNPDSDQQLQKLLFEVLELPVLQVTKSKAPATGKKVIAALVNHATNDEIKELLLTLIRNKDASKISTAFIPHFKNAPYCHVMKHHFLYGNFNLGGTVSGRLSSSDINLQQLPSKGTFAEVIKACFVAPEGWLFVGLDFDSLEDKVSALTTKDENKLKVYTDGYCGHSFRAYSYYPDLLGHLPNTVEGINSIKKLFPKLRDKSKEPTFLLTYWGTYHGLMRQCGFTEEEAKTTEERFNTLYAQSRVYITDKLNEAAKVGYVTVAFGLRVRTPLLHQTVLGTRSTPYEAQSEFRTAANACGQSYCLLNSRAGTEFMNKVRASKYAMTIRPCAQIHDASYYMVQNDVKIIKYVNDHLVQAASWQELPELKHDIVKLSGKLGIFYPSWFTEYPIENHASLEDIYNLGEEIANE